MKTDSTASQDRHPTPSRRAARWLVHFIVSLVFAGAYPARTSEPSVEEFARATLLVGSVVPYVRQETASGIKTAHVEASGSSPEGSIYSGLATVGLGTESPFLAAAVEGLAPSDRVKYAPWKTGGGVSASIFDLLQVRGIIPAKGWSDRNLPAVVEIDIRPAVSGTLNGNAKSVFVVSLNDSSSSLQYSRTERTWDTTWDTTSGPEGHILDEKGPRELVLQSFLDYQYLPAIDSWYFSSKPFSYSMKLEVSATSYPGFMASYARFQHTATLGAIHLSGPGGAPLPNYSSLEIVSSAGVSYQVDAKSANPGFVITSIVRARDSGKITVSWLSTPGSKYRVQHSPQLTSWTDLAPVVTATSTETSLTDVTAPGASTGYYRVRVEP